MKVSVIIPCFNVEQYIVECIDSVQFQTHKDLDIVCVDDGSTDKTGTLLRELQQTSSHPFQIISKENGGAPSARNRGISS